MLLQTLISHKAPRIYFLAPPPPTTHYVQGTNKKLPGSKVSQGTINEIFYLHDCILYISICSSLFWCYVIFDMCIIGYYCNKALPTLLQAYRVKRILLQLLKSTLEGG